MAKEINIGIIGLGNIGTALMTVLGKKRLGIKIVKVCDLRPRKTTHPFTRNYKDITSDPGIDVVVEAIGGENPALKIVMDAIKNNKHVVTPNKELMAKHMQAILSAAEKSKVRVLFEASVGGGIPILSALREGLSGNQVDEVYGIVNGTTNYVLTRMTKDGTQFSEALLSAKEKGYAEPNPSADINGHDAMYKAAILASVAFGAEINLKKISCEGIEKISATDIAYAKEIGYVIKLLAIAKREKDQIDVRVHPALVPCGHPLAAVSDNYNAIYVKGLPIGDLMFYGQGAGGGPTSSALIADILACAKPKLKAQSSKLKKYVYKKPDKVESGYYIRLEAPDKHGVLAGISKAFASNKVSIAAVIQKQTKANKATIVILLHKTIEKDLKAALRTISRLKVVNKISNVIRII